MYLALKHLHVATVAISFALFLLRGCLVAAGSRYSRTRFLRIAPHVVDTVLLASAVGLAIVLRQYPFVDDWLTAKVVALVVYVVLGSITLRRGRPVAVRMIAFLGAIGVFIWIVMTARGHSPWLMAG